MNVIVSNKQKGIIDNANIDAIKDLNGLFSVDDLVNKFKNYFFSKMILDATSVIDFATQEVLQKLADEIGADRLIILLPSTPEPPDEFKKILIDLKIYNFSNNIEDVVKFIEKPNTYENAISTIAGSYTGGDNFYVDSSIKAEEKVTSPINNYESSENNSVVSHNYASLGDVMSGLNIYDNDDTNANDVPDTIDNQESLGNHEEEEVKEEPKEEENTFPSYDLYNNQETPETIVDESVEKPESSSRVFLNIGLDDYDKPREKRIIGFKNITEHAGSTTLIYLLVKEATKRKENVVSVEINKEDFKLFHNNKMISVNDENLSDTLKSLREDVVFVDLNNYQDDSLCSEIIYLVEPSIIKLNKLMMVNRDIFDILKNEKVILNQSMLSESDIPILEKEANIKFFFIIGSINDRSDNSIISELFEKLLNK